MPLNTWRFPKCQLRKYYASACSWSHNVTAPVGPHSCGQEGHVLIYQVPFFAESDWGSMFFLIGILYNLLKSLESGRLTSPPLPGEDDQCPSQASLPQCHASRVEDPEADLIADWKLDPRSHQWWDKESRLPSATSWKVPHKDSFWNKGSPVHTLYSVTHHSIKWPC